VKIIKTETGSVYEFDEANKRARRVEYAHDLRGDGEWQSLLVPGVPQVGESWSAFWKLDLPDGSVVTLRTTSPVTSIEAAS